MRFLFSTRLVLLHHSSALFLRETDSEMKLKELESGESSEKSRAARPAAH